MVLVKNTEQNLKGDPKSRKISVQIMVKVRELSRESEYLAKSCQTEKTITVQKSIALSLSCKK